MCSGSQSKRMEGAWDLEHITELLDQFLNSVSSDLLLERIMCMSLLFAAAAAAKSLQSCLTLVTPETAAHQAPLSLGFSRQERWNGLPFPSPMHESEK